MSEIIKVNKCEIIFSLFIWRLIIEIREMNEFYPLNFIYINKKLKIWKKSTNKLLKMLYFWTSLFDIAFSFVIWNTWQTRTALQNLFELNISKRIHSVQLDSTELCTIMISIVNQKQIRFQLLMYYNHLSPHSKARTKNCANL